jgi:hypothetical protein
LVGWWWDLAEIDGGTKERIPYFNVKQGWVDAARGDYIEGEGWVGVKWWSNGCHPSRFSWLLRGGREWSFLHGC